MRIWKEVRRSEHLIFLRPVSYTHLAVAGMEVWGIHSVEELMDCLLKNKAPAVNLSKPRIPITQNKQFSEDFREINGQEAVRRAAEIAAAGMHNFLMVGSPGAGKTMIARRIPTILPSLSLEESLEGEPSSRKESGLHPGDRIEQAHRL